MKLIRVCLIIFFFLFAISESAAAANVQGDKTPISQTVISRSPYYTSVRVIYSDGTSLNEGIINGPPTPPPGYDGEQQANGLQDGMLDVGTVMLDVPAYRWSFGCSATSGAMIAAYYDRDGFVNMYTGPTNGGVMPLTSSMWSDWNDGHGGTYAQCPLTASRNGLDGRLTRGSLDDYWAEYGSSASDPYLTGSWTAHTWGDAIGDYMKTSQSSYENSDGSTAFWNYTSGIYPLTCSAMQGFGITNDGTVGRKLFYEARGYTVTDCYNQNTDNNNGGGFTFAMYKAEIDAGRPVMLNLEGHTVVGVGYDDTTQTIYIHDTWDFGTHTMPWGGSYSGMALLSVSIVNLSIGPHPALFYKTAPADGATDVTTSPTLSWLASEGATSYQYCYDTTDNDACDTTWISTGPDTSAYLSGLDPDTSYYWQARANNAFGTTYANGLETAYSEFTTSKQPGAFIKFTPVNTATGVSINPTLSWQASLGAASYEYCFDSVDDNACKLWISTDKDTSATLTGLDLDTTYYWQVRANNDFGTTYANGLETAFHTFTTGDVPAAFNKGAPADAAAGVSTSPTLTWESSSGAASYDYCLVSTGDTECKEWTDAGTDTSLALDGLDLATTYFWQVRAVNGFGVTYADGLETAYRSFTTGDVPSAFNKAAPVEAASDVSASPTLTWEASDGADSYEYCYDTTDDQNCKEWTETGIHTSVVLSELKLNSTYYWQVRAVNGFGVTYADGLETAYRSFTTGDVPGAFHKAAPAEGTTAVSTSPTLTWEASPGANSYEVCYDTSDNDTCNSTWVSAGENTRFDLTGLEAGTLYAWQVQAVNSFGTTVAGDDWFILTTIAPNYPIFLPAIFH